MVLVTQRQRPHRIHPNPIRIAGTSTALALHAGAILLLLAPVAMVLPTTEQVVVKPEWVQPRQPERLVPFDDQARPPTPQPPRAVVRPPTPQPPVSPPAIDQGTLQAPPPVAADPGDLAVAAVPAQAPPAASVRLEYVHAPPPAYPVAELRAGVEGTVVLEVLVGPDGRPIEVAIHRSSRNRRLDQVAREQVLREWRFQPAVVDGHAVSARGLVPVDFRIDR